MAAIGADEQLTHARPGEERLDTVVRHVLLSMAEERRTREPA